MGKTPVRYPQGSWPLEMRSDMAAAYVDEPSVESFLTKVEAGKYPRPLKEAQCQRKWLRAALDRAVASRHRTTQDTTNEDVAELI